MIDFVKDVISSTTEASKPQLTMACLKTAIVLFNSAVVTMRCLKQNGPRNVRSISSGEFLGAISELEMFGKLVKVRVPAQQGL